VGELRNSSRMRDCDSAPVVALRAREGNACFGKF
jgi:hypothetical protein